MDLQIIAIYFFTDEVLKSFGFHDDKQVKMTTAEIITLVLTAALVFHGNHRFTAHFLKKYRYIPNILSEGHLNYRLHQISEEIWNRIFSVLSSHFQKTNPSGEYAVDSFPINPTFPLFVSQLESAGKWDARRRRALEAGDAEGCIADGEQHSSLLSSAPR